MPTAYRAGRCGSPGKYAAGIKSLISLLPEALEDGSNELSPVARYALADQHRCLLDVREAMTAFLHQIEQLAVQHPAYVNLLPLPGIGPMIASVYIAAIGNGRQFKCGRQVSAWLGLVPRQYGTGGRFGPEYSPVRTRMNSDRSTSVWVVV